MALTANPIIARRIAFCFSVSIALGLAIVAHGAIALNGVRADIGELASSRLVAMAQFAELKDNMRTITQIARYIADDADPDLLVSDQRSINELRARNGDIVSKLENSITWPRGKDILATIKKNLAAYDYALNRLSEQVAKGEHGAASALLMSDFRSKQDAVWVALDESDELRREFAIRLARATRETESLTQLMTVGLALLVTTACIVASWILMRTFAAREE